MQNGTMQAGEIATLFNCNRSSVWKYMQAAGIQPSYTAKFGRGTLYLYDKKAVLDNSAKIASTIQQVRDATKAAITSTAMKNLAKANAAQGDKRSRLERIEQKLDTLCAALGVK